MGEAMTNIDKIREAFELTNSRDHRRHPPKGNNYIDPMAQADWESFQKGWAACRKEFSALSPIPVIVKTVDKGSVKIEGCANGIFHAATSATFGSALMAWRQATQYFGEVTQ
jgi:hypothetical protein